MWRGCPGENYQMGEDLELSDPSRDMQATPLPSTGSSGTVSLGSSHYLTRTSKKNYAFVGSQGFDIIHLGIPFFYVLSLNWAELSRTVMDDGLAVEADAANKWPGTGSMLRRVLYTTYPRLFGSSDKFDTKWVSEWVSRRVGAGGATSRNAPFSPRATTASFD
ncbi:hypothetical protein LY78DRAFT_386656 [Colletotrichum sublineola]|nr:hypothetical protein LY78DRAFT_386656 [Colletotrichum sublineola]